MEKFCRALVYDAVPIVLGGADYSCLAPPHSYIKTFLQFYLLCLKEEAHYEVLGHIYLSSFSRIISCAISRIISFCVVEESY